MAIKAGIDWMYIIRIGYKSGTYTKENVMVFVTAGKITMEQYYEVVGRDPEPEPEPEPTPTPEPDPEPEPEPDPEPTPDPQPDPEEEREGPEQADPAE